jgi:membrane protease YdiL (CAAX protease family)
LRAIFFGTALAIVAANVWPPLLFKLGMPLAACAEIFFLTGFVFWASGGGPPRRLRALRRDRFRVRALTGKDWLWGIAAAVAFAAAVHAAIVVLFRIVPYPAALFHRGYDFSFIPARSMRWTACIVSALSAAVCEETGFRGTMQQPIELRHSPTIAVLISSAMFTLVHLNKDWALVGMVPIVFGAGLLLGALAQVSGTLIFGIIGHTIMDIGLFGYWWTQIAGTFAQRPISESGMDQAFGIECAALGLLLTATLISIAQLRKLRVLAKA